jgi:hypothetical protein
MSVPNVRLIADSILDTAVARVARDYKFGIRHDNE